MTITKTTNGNHVTLAITGTIDTNTVQKLSEELNTLDYENLDLTLDFEQTTYITSAGLRCLLVARKKLSEDTMRVIHVSEKVAEVFKVTGFDSIIRIETVAESDNMDQYRLSFPALLKKRRESGPKKTAFVYKEREYTWEDVEMASHIIADDLAHRGIKKGSHVGLCCPNSINWVFTFFAIQKLGGIAVLVNPALSPKEILTISEVGDITHMCYGETPGLMSFEDCSDACLNNGKISNMYNIGDCVDITARYAEYQAISNLYRELFHADDASVVIFSSGSTGFPKAILSSSFNLMVSLDPIARKMKVSKEDINLAFLPMFHVFGFVTGIGAVLLMGCVSVIPENKAPATMIRLIKQYQCTMFNSVPAMMLAVVYDKTFTPESLSSLRMSILGGSATTEAQMKMLRQILPNNHFGNIYGMSENAAVSLTDYEDTVEHITQTVGKPVSGLELEIRDVATGKPVAPGETGEICIRSNAMVVCYYRLPIEKQPVDDEGWLATGDLGVLDSDGYLRIVGRTKELIISGGENISPGEIAEVIARLPEVADVKVVGVPDEIKGEVVAAALVLKDGFSWNEEAARQYLRQYLAKYKIPVYFALFEKFPLLSTGKVDALTLKKEVAKAVLG